PGCAVAVRRGTQCDRGSRPGAHRAAGRTDRHAFRRAGPARARRAVLCRLARAPRTGGAAGDGAKRAGACLLERAVAEGDRRPPRHPGRHGEDADAQRAAASRRGARRRAVMKEPDFRELVGDEGTPEELAKLRRAHDLLVAAGPPPELSPRLAEAPSAV